MLCTATNSLKRVNSAVSGAVSATCFVEESTSIQEGCWVGSASQWCVKTMSFQGEENFCKQPYKHSTCVVLYPARSMTKSPWFVLDYLGLECRVEKAKLVPKLTGT